MTDAPKNQMIGTEILEESAAHVGPYRCALPQRRILVGALNSLPTASVETPPKTPRIEPASGSGDPPAAPPRSLGGTVLRNSGIYLFGNLMQKATAFVLIPIYTTNLSTAQYGLLELANTLVNLLLVAAALGVPSAINKCFHRDCRDEMERRGLAGTAILFSLLTSGTLALAGWALEARLAGLVFHGPEAVLIYRCCLVWLVLAQLALIPFELLRASGRARVYLGLSLAQLLAQFGCTLYLVLGRDLALAGVLAGNLAGLGVVNLVGGLVLFRHTSWRFDPRLLRTMIAYGLAMIPVFISSWVVNLSDRFFIQSYLGLGALGIYALGYKFGALIDLLLVMPFQRAWTPIFFGMTEDSDAPQALARVTTYLAAALAFASVGVSLAVPPFLRLGASADFRSASGIVPLICLAYLVGGLANCLGNGLIVAERVRLIAVYAVLAALVNLALNVLLIPWLGTYGAAISTVLAFAVQLGGVLRSLKRYYPVRLEWGRLGRVAVAAILPLGAAFRLPSLPLTPDLLLRAALLAVFPALLILLRVAQPEETAAARRLFGRLRSTIGGRL